MNRNKFKQMTGIKYWKHNSERKVLSTIDSDSVKRMAKLLQDISSNEANNVISFLDKAGIIVKKDMNALIKHYNNEKEKTTLSKKESDIKKEVNSKKTESPKKESGLCIAIVKSTGRLCGNKAKEGSDFCGRHQPKK